MKRRYSMSYLRIVQHRKQILPGRSKIIAKLLRRAHPGITRVVFPLRFRQGKFVFIVLVPMGHLRLREIHRIISEHEDRGLPVATVRIGAFHCLRLVYDHLEVSPATLQGRLSLIVEWTERAFGLRAVPFPHKGRMGAFMASGMFRATRTEGPSVQA